MNIVIDPLTGFYIVSAIIILIIAVMALPTMLKKSGVLK